MSVAVLAAAGQKGLWRLDGGWQRLPCPLERPSLLAACTGGLAVLDESAHLAWHRGATLRVDSGVEAMHLWRGLLLTLSGDTDCLTLWHPRSASPLMTLPAGVYPQDMCLLPDGLHAAVCGGADGTVRIVRLTDFTVTRSLRLPGQPQRIATDGRSLYALCLMEDHDLCSLLCRIPLRMQGHEPLRLMPGLPGAVCAAEGSLWAASSETLQRLTPAGWQSIPCECGLIRRMDCRGGRLLASDPVMDVLWLVEGGQTKMLHEGDVQHGVFV